MHIISKWACDFGYRAACVECIELSKGEFITYKINFSFADGFNLLYVILHLLNPSLVPFLCYLKHFIDFLLKKKKPWQIKF